MPDAIPHFEVQPVMLKEISQSMLDAKAKARYLENTADAMIPLTDNVTVRELLKRLSNAGTEAAKAANDIYLLIAREAARPAE